MTCGPKMDTSANARSLTLETSTYSLARSPKSIRAATTTAATAGISSTQRRPCGTVHRARIDTTDVDRSRGYNRAEHLRQHVKTDAGDSVYDRCYGWREDSESLNNTLDRTLYGGRMVAYTALRQLTVMLGFALGRNAIAAYLHRRRHPEERAA
jgi:hypothetical protein